MSLTITTDQVIRVMLQRIIDSLEVSVCAERGLDKVLKIRIDPELVLEAIDRIPDELIVQLKEHTGNREIKYGSKAYDNVEIHFDGHVSKYKRLYKIDHRAIEDGWEKR